MNKIGRLESIDKSKNIGRIVSQDLVKVMKIPDW